VATTTYAAVLASVPVEQIDRVRRGASVPGGGDPLGQIELVASRVERCPHDLTGLEVFPLGRILAEAIDVGQPLRNDVWHPLRAPMVVDPETVMARAMKLEDALGRARGELSGLMADAVGTDIERVCQLYAHASRQGEAVVTFLASDTGGEEGPGAATPHVRVG
jgi:hypothetical protein